ncbi:MAG: hypothetical protein A3K19_24005 [Lentisphaerae bacterium RIFOXYB12_FULL_65_16]|nr:MAG: hypothetical protein A3K18_10280 [Lentisphaerae bacterium RIFOXYA12_64_32]OGV89592.1 MAG: hypothetical protein A3K19_24005 [Lentisphaerae bacterium RIFOXYB12_FULL_65_16]
MLLRDIVWLPQVLDKLNWEHGFSRQEVEEVLKSRPLFRKVQRGHSTGEHLYSALGQTGAGRFVVIFFVYKRNREALIISGRDMDPKERRLYGRK